MPDREKSLLEKLKWQTKWPKTSKLFAGQGKILPKKQEVANKMAEMGQIVCQAREKLAQKSISGKQNDLKQANCLPGKEKVRDNTD